MNTSSIRLIEDRQRREQLIDELDFSLTKLKLVKEGSMTSEQAEKMEQQYRQFLKLCLRRSGSDRLVPHRRLDDFWHAHILDTRKYQKDCQDVFGGMLHHFPYFGMRDERDAQDLKDSFARTSEIWEEEFGQKYLDPASVCDVPNPSGCENPPPGDCDPQPAFCQDN